MKSKHSLSNEKLQHVETLLWHIADDARNNGTSLEKSMLGAFVALTALHLQPNIKLSWLPDDNAELISKSVSDFEHHFLKKNNIDVLSICNIQFDSTILYHFLHHSLQMDLSDNDLVEILDWIISNLSISMNELTTPEDISDLMVKLVDINTKDKVFDPAMGTAGFLKAIIRAKIKDVSFTGIEINSIAYFISTMFSLLKSVPVNLLQGSAFYYSNDSSVNNFDVVLSNPPVSRVTSDEARYHYQKQLSSSFYSTEMSLNFIEFSLNKLKSGGRAAFLVNMKPLFAMGEVQQIRRHWIDYGLLKYVISLPSNLLEHTGLKCAILIFEKRNNEVTESEKTVKLIKAEDCFIDVKRSKRIITSDSATEILRRVRKVNDGILAKEIGYSELSENNYVLVPDQYLNQQIGAVNLSLSKIWRPLGDLALVLQGGRFSKLPDGDEPIIQGRDLRVEKLDIDEMDKKDLSEYSKPINRSRAYDILLQRIGDKPAAYCVLPAEEDLAIADTVFIIRSSEPDPDLMEFIAQFINSIEGRRRINEANHYAVVQTQSIRSIKEIEVPVPESNVISLVKEMNEIEKALRDEYLKAAQLRKSIFGGFDEADLETNFNKVRFTSHALESALSQKDDVNYKIRNMYPFPIAFAYRNIYVEREYAAIYDRQMKYGEHLLSFLASIGISLVVGNKNEITESTDDLFSLIKNTLPTGFSPGHWWELLQRSCSLLRTIDGSSLASEFSSILYKGRGKKESDFAALAKKELIEKLNDFKHGRGPINSHEFKVEVDKQSNILRALLDDLEFLTQCDMILIDDINTNWVTGDPEFKASLLKGDHPAFESISFTSDKALSKDKLYIRYANKFICLYPLLSFQYNPNTKKQEIFSLDKMAKNRVKVKSFDSGTTSENKNFDIDFNYWLDSHILNE